MSVKLLTLLAGLSLSRPEVAATQDNPQDSEKGPEPAASTPSEGQLDVEDAPDVDDEDHDDLDDLAHDRPEDEPEDDHDSESSRRTGIRLSRFSTSTSTTSVPFTRPGPPKWLMKLKDFLFATHHHEDEEYIPNYRTTPIISGSLIPFAILLEIPGLTDHWYVRTENRQVVEVKDNPAILDAGLALSMTCAVLANVALVCRLMEKRVKAMTIASIFFLTIHDVINIIIVTVFGVQHRFNDGFTYGEAYWMTVCSTAVSMITNFTLIYDLVTTPNFSKSGSGVTRKQRSLVIITIVFLSYIALGALISSLMMYLSFLNGLFFTIVTTLTIGFGDIVPVTTAQRIVVCAYAVFGIIILGAAVRLTTEAVIEGLEIGYRLRVRKFRERRHKRRKSAKETRRWRTAVESRLKAAGLPVWIVDTTGAGADDRTPTAQVRPSVRRGGSRFKVAGRMRLNVGGLSPAQQEEAAQEAGVPLQQFVRRTIVKDEAKKATRREQVVEFSGDASPAAPSQTSQTPLADGEEDASNDQGSDMQNIRNKQAWSTAWWTENMRKLARVPAGGFMGLGTDHESEDQAGWMYADTVKAMHQEEKRTLYIKLGLAWTLFFLFWTIGSVIFSQTENWSYGTAMYFCFITFTTIGYGDLAPVTPIGRAIFIFWALFGVGAMTTLIAVISDTFSSKYKSATHSKRFDTAVRKYREGGRQPKREEQPRLQRRSGSSALVPALRANLTRLTAPKSAGPASRARTRTLAEAEACLRERFEPLPMLVLEEVQKLREHVRYFLASHGHAGGLATFGVHPEAGSVAVAGAEERTYDVQDSLKALLDEIAQTEGIGERLKEEVWQDDVARNTLFMLSLEKSICRMVDAADAALEVVAERDRLLAESNQDTKHLVVDQPKPKADESPLADIMEDSRSEEEDSG
ncbi:voltage-gated potassium channel [Artomyces pyxidatus]|uniref:Voltage-gated potassium channel n=1 Tax=Artomyces pyxidatus TaxID=48021 RepID=A0ACB8SJJ5_9AGAM|nr:voltage-gated potassium channel [Artomyces pyxidatus]